MQLTYVTMLLCGSVLANDDPLDLKKEAKYEKECSYAKDALADCALANFCCGSIVSWDWTEVEAALTGQEKMVWDSLGKESTNSWLTKENNN